MDKAVECLKKCAEIAPKQCASVSMLGKIMLETKEYDKAREFFNVCTKLEPDNSIYYLDIGKCLIQAEKYTESIEFLNKSIDLNHKDALAFYLKGNWFEIINMY